jgi:asparagine synthetase B (glutamine-hydrolysing)
MPGLVGIVSLNGDKVDVGLMQAMRDAIRHRKEYRVDDYVSANGAVAVSRVHLGIINKEKQPYSARNGLVQIFLHGDIYNDEVAQADPLDFIYHLYEKKGWDFASSLNGSFVIVILDLVRDMVLIANDRTAAKPLFCFNDGRAIYFGPEMKSLFLLASLKRQLNHVAVADFLATGYFTGEHTWVEGIQVMDSATVLKITRGGLARHKYWKFELERGKEDRGSKYYQGTLAELLRQSATRHLRADGVYGVLLSGGYDSRGILGCCLEQKKGSEINSISWGRQEDIPNSDCLIAKQLAQKLGIRHGFYKLLPEQVMENFNDFVLLGEGLTDYPESFAVFHKIREKQGVDIVLRGDECFGWSNVWVHDEYTMMRRIGILRIQDIKSYQRILKPHYYRLFSGLNAETTRSILSKCNAKHMFDRMDLFHLDVRIKHYLNPLNYVKTFALESVTPLLDYDILDFVTALPVKHRIDASLYHKTLEGMFPQLFEQNAHVRNDINWATSLKSLPELKSFVYQQLSQEPNILGEFIDRHKLNSELDAFFSANPTPLGLKAGSIAQELRDKSRTALNLAHKSSYYIRRWTGRLPDPLPPEKLILRLLIFKVWGDIFLSYPTAKTSMARS